MKKTITQQPAIIHPLFKAQKFPSINKGQQLKTLGKARFFARTRRGSI